MLRAMAQVRDASPSEWSKGDDLEAQDAKPVASVPPPRRPVLTIVLWYCAASLAVVTSKKCLSLGGAPRLLSLSQSMIAAIICWAAMRGRSATLPRPARFRVARVAIVYTLGFFLTNVSLMLGNASFTETVKASEPVASVLLALVMLGETPSSKALLSMAVLMTGTALSCFGEGTSFSGWGLVTALAANVMFALRSVFTKQLRSIETQGKVTPTCLFFFVSLAGTAMNIAMYMSSSEPGIYQLQSLSEEQGQSIFPLLLLNGTAYGLYNLSSFKCLDVMPVAEHAVFNVFRRVFIITATMIAFNVPPTVFGTFGVLLSVAGFILYLRR